MTPPSAPRVLAGTVFLVRIAAPVVLAQNCYFPNGDLDTQGQSTACFPGGGACCPLHWDCLENGLCYDPAAKYWGRYTCTDKSWPADGDCPQFCTHNGTAGGNEAVKQCSDGSWCCDGNRVSIDCCTIDDAEVLHVAGFDVVTAITSAWLPTLDRPSSTTAVSTSSTTDLSTTSSSTSSTTSPSLSSATPDPLTFTSASASTNAAGVATTIVLIQTTSPPSAVAATSSGFSNKSLIIGIAIGIPLFLLAALVLAYLLYRRRKRNTSSLSEKSSPSSDPAIDAETIDMYKPPPSAAEIDSYPVAVPGGKPGHESQISELSASHYPPQHMSSGSPQSPAVSNITTKRDSQSLPQYSPVSLFNHTGSSNGNPGNSTPLPQVQEENGPVELWASLPLSQPQPPPRPHVQDWAAPRAARNSIGAYPAHMPFPRSQDYTTDRISPQLPPPPTTTTRYAPYRPPPPVELPDSRAEAGGAWGSPPPRDEDRGQLGVGLRVVNT